MSLTSPAEFTLGQFQYILDQLPQHIFWKDKESRYLGCNQSFAQDAGLTNPAEIVGKTDFDLSWASSATELHGQDQEIIATGLPFISDEELLNDSHGPKFWLNKKKFPIRNQQGEPIGILGIYEDISTLRRSQIKEVKVSRAFDLLINANQAMVLAQDENSLFVNVCRLAIKVGYIMAWVGLANSDEQKSVSPVAHAGAVDGYLKNIKISWGNDEYGKGPTGTSIREVRTVVNQNFLTNPAMLPWRDSAIKIGYQANIALPIIYPEVGAIAALTIYAIEPNSFNAEEVALLEELAKLLAFGISAVRGREKLLFQNEEKAKRLAELVIANEEKAKRLAELVIANEEKAKRVAELIIANEEKVKRAAELVISIRATHQAEDKMLASLTSLSLARDNETGNHVIRTQIYVRALAARLLKMGKYLDQINEEYIDLVFKAAPLHDIGKVGIPDLILRKPGKLNDEEWLVMQTHTTIGESVLSAAHLESEDENTVIDIAIKIAGGHHEHWDGTGYPRGLKSESIPLAARIMSVADVYDALVSKRVYKGEWTHEQAVKEIILKSGTQFDPVIVDAFALEEGTFHEISQQYHDA